MQGHRFRKQFRIKKGADPREIETLPHIITLMMFKDAILSSYRWYLSVIEGDHVESFSDCTFSIVCGAGWAAEATRLLKDLKTEDVISEETIRKLPKAAPVDPKTVWTECVAGNNSTEMNRLHGIRDACFAHFHNRGLKPPDERYKLAHQVIDDLANCSIDAPFVEWAEEDGKKSNFRSCNTIAMLAMLKHMFGITGGNILKPPKLLGKQIMKVGILLEHLITVMIVEAGIEFEPCTSAAEAETSGGD